MQKLLFIFAAAILFSSFLTLSAQETESVELPMKMRGLTPAVEVMVNGKGPFLFAIDTGAQGAARIDSSLVAQLGLKPTGQIQGGDGSGQNTRTMETFTLDSINVGGLNFKAVEAPSRNYNVSPNVPKIDGILGFNLFADYLLTLDYPAQKVRIERGELPAVDGKDVLSFDSPRGVPVVEILVGSQTLKADIDSGNMVGGFMLPTALVEKSALASEPVVVGRARTVTSDVEIKQVRLKDAIHLGGFEFADPTVTYPSLSAGNIGSKILSNFVLTFDQKNRRVQLTKTSAAITAKPSAAPETTNEYAGKYGDRTVSAENGDLYIQRPNGMKLKLVSVAKDEFTLEQVPAARLKFARDADGKIIEIQILTPAGVWEKATKDKP